METQTSKQASSAERRKLQNRIAQRNHRNVVKQKLESHERILELLESIATKPSHSFEEQNNHGMNMHNNVAISLEGATASSIPAYRKERSSSRPDTYILEDLFSGANAGDPALSPSSSDNDFLGFPSDMLTPVPMDNTEPVIVPTEGSTGMPDSTRFRSPILDAITSNNNEIVALLLDRGVNLLAVDGMGSTPLHLASRIGNVGAVELLMQHPDSMRLQRPDSEGLLPLDVAIRNNHTDVVRVLLDAGVDVNGAASLLAV